jgi:hypothetical protein
MTQLRTTTTTLHLPLNPELARTYFPQLVRMLPPYRQALLRNTHPTTWHLVSTYVSTYYGALTCATSQDDLQTLSGELARFVDAIPTQFWYYKTTHIEVVLSDLIEAGNRLVTSEPQLELFFLFIGILSIAQAVIFDQQLLDRLRDAMERLHHSLSQEPRHE